LFFDLKDIEGVEVLPVGVLDPKALCPEDSSLNCLVPPVVGDLGTGDIELLRLVFLNFLSN
jgi:hypothetical protein